MAGPSPHSPPALPHHLRGGHHDLSDRDQPQHGDPRHRLICFAPQVLSAYWLSTLIQIGIFAIAALGLNILVGFTGQISIGHAAFFLLGAFTSAYVSNTLPIPVFFAIPLAGVVTALVGLIFGLPGRG